MSLAIRNGHARLTQASRAGDLAAQATGTSPPRTGTSRRRLPFWRAASLRELARGGAGDPALPCRPRDRRDAGHANRNAAGWPASRP